MTKFQSLLKDLERSILRLEEVLKQEKNDFIRDSAIQRFELTFDLAWKTIKAFLEEYHSLTCTSPKTCFKEAYRQGLIDYDEFWLDIVEYRNKTVHTYQEELAEQVYEVLPKILSYFQKLLASIKKYTREEN